MSYHSYQKQHIQIQYITISVMELLAGCELMQLYQRLQEKPKAINIGRMWGVTFSLFRKQREEAGWGIIWNSNNHVLHENLVHHSCVTVGKRFLRQFQMLNRGEPTVPAP